MTQQQTEMLSRLVVASRQPPIYPQTVVSRAGIVSAVLVPLVAHADQLSILLTRRTDHLASHRGQVCFPGGRAEDADCGPVDTALREAWEEVGIVAKAVTVIGCLDDYETLTGFVVTPVVGLIRQPLILRKASEEVADTFEMPLAFLLDTTHHRRLTPAHSQFRRTIYAIPYEGHYIWGATAAILMTLYHILTAESGLYTSEKSCYGFY